MKNMQERRRNMAQKEYRELSCRETGADCDFLVRAETAEEASSVASEHGCRVHNVCEITPEARDRMNSLMRSVWCGGEFVDIQEAGPNTPREEGMEN
jgi:predicted small metal-binding protein